AEHRSAAVRHRARPIDGHPIPSNGGTMNKCPVAHGAPADYATKDIPPDAVRVTSMEDCLFVLRSPDVRQEPSGLEAPFREGTILRLDGAEHKRQRRVLNPLVRREAGIHWRQD